MSYKYREDKATQIAALFLELGGGEMDIIKLVKLIYLAEREAIVRWGRPIIFDSYCSLPHGPVTSITLNLMNSTLDIEPSTYWHKYIAERDGHCIKLTGEKAPKDQLSKAEEGLVDEIFREYGRMDKWQLRDLTHKLPEWKDPDGSSLPIPMSEILAAEGFTKDDIEGIESALATEEAAQALIG